MTSTELLYNAIIDLKGEVAANTQSMVDHEVKDDERHAAILLALDKSATSDKNRRDNRVSRAFAAALVLLAGCFTLGGVALAHVLR